MPVTLNDKIHCRELLKEIHANTLTVLAGGASNIERDTWSIKESAAIAVLKGEATVHQTQMLQAECHYAGTDLITLAELIVHKANEFRLAIGITAGIYSSYISKIESLNTKAALASLPASFTKALGHVTTL